MRCFKYLKFIRALAARGMFAFHALLAIWRASIVYEDYTFWCFTVLIVVIFIEGGVNIFTREGNETRWFCASIFLYLCATVPPLWFLELFKTRQQPQEYIQDQLLKKNQTEDTLLEFTGIKLRIPVDPDTWVQILEQTLLVVLIIGRWILPKGDISREQLSNLLLVYLAISADTIELFEVFKEQAVRHNLMLTVGILTIWSTSLLQFCLVITQASHKGKKLGWFSVSADNRTFSTISCPSRVQLDNTNTSAAKLVMLPPPKKKKPSWRKIIENVEVWAIVITVLLQDGPFLGMRLYLVIQFKLNSYSMYFFTCKNTLICMLQFYRLVVIASELSRTHKMQELAHSNTEALILAEGGDETEPPVVELLTTEAAISEIVEIVKARQASIVQDEENEENTQVDQEEEDDVATEEIVDKESLTDDNDNKIKFTLQEDPEPPPSACYENSMVMSYIPDGITPIDLSERTEPSGTPPPNPPFASPEEYSV